MIEFPLQQRHGSVGPFELLFAALVIYAILVGSLVAIVLVFLAVARIVVTKLNEGGSIILAPESLQLKRPLIGGNVPYSDIRSIRRLSTIQERGNMIRIGTLPKFLRPRQFTSLSGMAVRVSNPTPFTVEIAFKRAVWLPHWADLPPLPLRLRSYRLAIPDSHVERFLAEVSDRVPPNGE
jgi:hypothetical protein